MRLGTSLVAVFFTACGVVAAVWLSAPTDVESTSNGARSGAASEWPEIDADKDGVHPKAVAVEPEYDFGLMGLKGQQSHTFVIRNEGDDPLVLVKGPTTCKCTLSRLGQDEVAPGESADVTLEWTPDSPMPQFFQSAEIRTNDPENRTIKLVVQGQVRPGIDVMPGSDWMVGDIPSNEPAVFTGQVISGLRDEFQILDVEGSEESISATWTPLDDDALVGVAAKSGYAVTVTVQPGDKAGPWNGQLKTPTDVEDHETIEVLLFGNRHGPFQVLPLPGASWNPSALAADLGRFPASKGYRAELLMFVTPPADREFQFEDIQTEPSYLKVVPRPIEGAESERRLRYRITLEIPPGVLPANRTRKNSGTVRLLTNHPGATEIKLRVEFIIDADS